MSIVCEQCSRIVFAKTFIHTKTTVPELPGGFVMITDFVAGWPVIDSDLK